MDSVTWSGFAIGVLQTAIGAALGLGFSLFTFHYQKKRERQERAQESEAAALDALNRAEQASGLNIEALALIKIQIAADLNPEVNRMKKLIDLYYNSIGSNKEDAFHKMRSESEKLRHYYESSHLISIMPAPEFREFSLLSNQMPALTGFLHRAMSTMHELNYNISQRNSVISDYAREGQNGNGLTSDRFVYYQSMISGYSEYICQSVDNNLEFFKLVREQINYYFVSRKNESSYVKYDIAEKAKQALPKDDIFPELRKRLEKFGLEG